MAKEPRAGAAKRRLARDVGAVAAVGFQRVMLRHVVARLGPDPRWRAVLAVTPDGSLRDGMWPMGMARLAQGPGDLGARMQRLLDRLPPGPVLVVGTDIPRLRPVHIARAFRLLGRHDAVLGPAGDGGYWLVGLRRSPKVLRPFAGVRWSSRHALADTAANLKARRVAIADPLDDVDDGPGYRRLRGAGSRLVLPRGVRG